MITCNLLNWIQKILLYCAVLLILIGLQQTMDSFNFVNWIPKISLHFAVLLKVIAVQQCG